MDHININGKIAERGTIWVPADNGAFRYGNGLFETMLVQNGQVSLAPYHWERLFAGMETLSLQLPSLYTAAWLEQEVLRTVQKNKLEHLCRVRLQVYAGGGGLYGAASQQAGFIIECFALEPAVTEFNENGLVVGFADGLCKSVDSLSNLKSCNALIYAVAAQQAKRNKWNDALIANTSGNIIESTIANIFWVKNGSVYTPPLSEGCIAGVMRRYIMTKTTVTEQPATTACLLEADEIFLTNAVKRMRWVAGIGDENKRQTLSKKLYIHCFS